MVVFFYNNYTDSEQDVVFNLVFSLFYFFLIVLETISFSYNLLLLRVHVLLFLMEDL